MKSLKDLDFTEKIEFVKQRSMGVPKMFNIDLSIAATDQVYNLAGNFFFIWGAPDESSYISIKVNETRENAIPFSVHTGAETPFYRLFITTPGGQSGTMQIIYATEAPEFLRLIDNRSTTVAGVGGILDELRGDLVPERWGLEVTVGNAVAVQMLPAYAFRKACIIQAKSTNAGIVYLGFDNTVTTTTWVAELQAGMSFTVDNYRGPIWARATMAGQLASYGEW